jgi:2-methylcitrate dehydratase
MKEIELLSQYITSLQFSDLHPKTIESLKIRVLDSMGCAIGALDGPPIQMIRKHIEDFGGNPIVTLIGGSKTSPDRAAFYNSALIRYLDFNDSFLAKKETCHPSDNIGAILAATEYAKGSGKDFLLSIAIAYQVQCRLSEVAPVRHKGFDHTTQGTYAVAAGVSKALKLTEDKTSNALALSAVPNNALRVTRTGKLSHWKGLAYPQVAFTGTHAAFLAYRGITGPLEVFEGNKGFKEAISGPFEITWTKNDIDIVLKTIIKKYNAEIHSQTSIEAVLDLRNKQHLKAEDVVSIDVSIFDVAFNIIGGGEEGSKKEIRTKEEADHSLPYMIAVALIDGEVTPAQYIPARIVKKDVQELLHKISIHPSKEFSERFPKEMPTLLKVKTKEGKELRIEKDSYPGFNTNPMTWDQALEKYNRLCRGRDKAVCRQIAEGIKNIDNIQIHDFTNLLSKVK